MLTHKQRLGDKHNKQDQVENGQNITKCLLDQNK